jgi:hypothetical protein
MKNKTPALKAEVLRKALDGELHTNLTCQIYRMQWLTAARKLTPEAAAIVAFHLDGGKHG